MWRGGRRSRAHDGVVRAAAVAVALLAATSLGGCSSEAPFAGSDIAPTGVASPALAEIATPPVGARVVDGNGWQIAVPGAWEERRRDLGDLGEVVRWSQPVPSGAVTTALSVVVDRRPARSLLEQSYQLDQRLRENQIIPVRSALTRSDSDSPGVLVQWREHSRGDVEEREVWQIFVQGRDGAIYNAVGYAPADGFVASGMAEVLGTLRVDR